MSRMDRKELGHPQISGPGEICSGAAAEGHRAPWTRTTLGTSCHSGHFVVSYTPSKLLSLSDLGFFYLYFTESQNYRTVWKGP